jgi:hypothetical protein
MPTPAMTPLARRATAALLAAGLCAPPLAAASSRPLGAESPEALGRRLTAAAESGDLGEIAACLEPAARAEMALGLLAGVSMMMAFTQMGADMAGGLAAEMGEAISGEALTPEQKAELEKGQKEAAAKMAGVNQRFEAVLARHGLTALAAGAPMPGEFSPEEAQARLKDVDQVTLIEELMGVMSDLNPEAKDTMKHGKGLYREFADLKVEGDTATARSGGQQVEMVKVEGRWYLKPTHSSPPASPGEG